jgi:hypothetical protein
VYLEGGAACAPQALTGSLYEELGRLRDLARELPDLERRQWGIVFAAQGAELAAREADLAAERQARQAAEARAERWKRLAAGALGGAAAAGALLLLSR